MMSTKANKNTSSRRVSSSSLTEHTKQRRLFRSKSFGPGSMNAPKVRRNRSLSSDEIEGSPRSSHERRQSTPVSRYARRGSVSDIDGFLNKRRGSGFQPLSSILEKEKQELKTKITELEDYKTKYEDQKKENQILQNRLSELMAGQTDTTQNLMKANDSIDRLRLDQKKKTEQIEKFQRDLSFKDDRIRNLEIRASEVEKAELILETTKQNLESQIHQVRYRDGQILKLENNIDDLERRLQIANNTIKDQTEKVEDLKLQVRHELLKNDNVEKNLEMIPRLKDTIQEKDDEIHSLQRQLSEKTALLTAARKAVRDYKDKLKFTESEISLTHRLKKDLRMSECEILSLKKLMYGKDYLVTQKTKALDLSKEIIEVLNDNMDNDHVHRIQHLIDRAAGTPLSSHHSGTLNNSSSRLDSLSSPSDSEVRSSSSLPYKHRSSYPSPGQHHTDISVNHHPYSIENNQHSNQNGDHGNQKVFLNKVIGDMSHSKRKRPMSAMGQPMKHKSSLHRTSSLREAQKVYRKPQPRKGNSYDIYTASECRPNTHTSGRSGSAKMKPSLDYEIGTHEENDTTEGMSDCESPRDAWTHKRDVTFTDDESVFSDNSDCEDDITSDQELVMQRLSAKEKDELLSEIIIVGTRVLISCPQKPPKYGKKRVLKPINYTGIVKFRGKFENAKYDARVQVGVRMDEAVGDTDGTYKGKRYMYTPSDQGRYFKIREITSVLNVKTGRYSPAKRLLLHHLQKKKLHQSQELEEKQ